MNDGNQPVDPTGGMFDPNELQELQGMLKESQSEMVNPVGSFVALIESANFGKSQSGNHYQITYKLKIHSGEFAGRVITKYDGFKSAKQGAMTLKQLRRLGIPAETLGVQQIPAVLTTLPGKYVAITCKDDGTFYNIGFDKLVDTGTGVAQQMTNNDVPF